jgi:hypothetical protein
MKLSTKRVSGLPRRVVQMCTDYFRMLAEQPWGIYIIYMILLYIEEADLY